MCQPIVLTPGLIAVAESEVIATETREFGVRVRSRHYLARSGRAESRVGTFVTAECRDPGSKWVDVDFPFEVDATEIVELTSVDAGAEGRRGTASPLPPGLASPVVTPR